MVRDTVTGSRYILDTKQIIRKLELETDRGGVH